MLARAAGRRLRRHVPSTPPMTPAGQLSLPWLCPALSRSSSHLRPGQTRQATQTRDGRRPRRPSFASRRDTRTLATATDLQPAPEYHAYQQWARQMPAPALSRLLPWDASKPLVVRDTMVAAPAVRATHGMGSDPMELHQSLYACLRVGRVDRAAVILDRLMSIYSPTAPEAIDAQNTYLQALFELGQQEAGEEQMKTIDAWHRCNMVAKGIPSNAQTFVTLLRSAMNFLDADTQQQSIRDYLSAAREYGLQLVDEINASPDFTDEEWDTLIRLQPDTYEEPPSIQEVQSLHVSTPAARKSLIDHGLATPAQTIKPVPQKGMGLDSLKQALAMFEDGGNVTFPHDMQGTKEEQEQAYAYARQLQMERDSIDAAVERWKHEDQKLQDMGIHGVLNTKPIQAIMYQWYQALIPLFKQHIEHSKQILSAPLKENTKDDAQAYGIYLEKCKPEKLAAITVSRILQACVRSKTDTHQSLKVAALTITLGNEIQDYLNAEADARRVAFLKKQRRENRKVLISKLAKGSPTPSIAPSPVTSDMSALLNAERIEIASPVGTKLGALCLELVLRSAKITITVDDAKTGKVLSHTVPTFQHQTGYHNGKRIGLIVPHHELMKKLRSEPVHAIHNVRLPMVVEPKAWTGFDQGGYYTIPSNFVRQKNSDSAQKAYAQSAIENGDMDQVLAGLDVLGKIPWQINGAVFEVMAQAWNSGQHIGALVGEEHGLQLPPEPPSDATYQERAKWGREMKNYENTTGGLHSQRCFINFVLETARSFLNEKTIYFPHSVDFRGRAYPIPPILNHIGSDLSRGLLKFANGKELGTIGLQWLKIHLANLYGFDKASLREREQFAMDNIDEIHDSAMNPLTGRRWWTKAEDPWQCLACCMELRQALNSPDPRRFVSQLPVHQDGTCNGLQHYAALGGDHAGARQVNLEPSDRPQDIYTGVAELVKEMIVKDAARNDPFAKFLDGHITRKVVKRTVMTNVYGVTFMGAKEQVLDELRHIFPNFQGDAKIRTLSSLALYVATKIFQALGQIFNGAQEIQYWLGECGDRITTSITAEQVQRIGAHYDGKNVPTYDAPFKEPKNVSKAAKSKSLKNMEVLRTSIIWTTPLKMPIVQPYRKDSVQVVRTKIQDITMVRRNNADMIDKRKQLQAFPPNFIHSLDATHMILSALKCSETGLDFAAVHDSFWTHACDIPTLNTILRDAFVRMHTEDIMGRLHAEFTARYAGALYRASLKSNSVAAQKIHEWRKSQRNSTGTTTRPTQMRTSEATFKEVGLEAKRLELLNSSDPELRKKGEDMVTPTSIWLAHQDPKAIHSHRLNLLGESKDKKSAMRKNEVRDKIFSAEADAVNADTAKAENIEPIFELPAEEQVDEAGYQTARDKPASSSVRSTKYHIDVWLPLTFPPVPEKGGWDVSRLRESKYFFS
ncbi:DNA-directed RNA polymerase [Coniothyrium glycines]